MRSPDEVKRPLSSTGPPILKEAEMTDARDHDPWLSPRHAARARNRKYIPDLNETTAFALDLRVSAVHVTEMRAIRRQRQRLAGPGTKARREFVVPQIGEQAVGQRVRNEAGIFGLS